MSLASFKRFLPVPPPRQVALLPDALFFVRAVPVAAGASAIEVAAQAELAIEALAPFPLGQLYHGHHWLPGADHALVYAAYRRRFSAEETASWADAEAVLPSFVAVLGKSGRPAPATVLIVPGETSITGIFFADAGGVPAQVRTEPLPEDATPDVRDRAHTALLAAFPEKLHEITLESPPRFEAESPQGEWIFHAGAHTAVLSAADLGPLDVRDKGDLASRRRTQARDLVLWRCFVGCAAAIALAAALELALAGASLWQKSRLAREAAQRPVVEAIMTSQSLATRIEELSTKRLLPFEMLALVNSVRPGSIQFVRTVTNGLHALEVEAQTGASGEIDAFRSALNRLPGCEKAEVVDPRSRDGVSTFRLLVKFKPDAFKSIAPEAVPQPPPDPVPPIPEVKS